ncbi:cytosolic beta-glucosidase-like [Epargyreus clarus]|uniref:cytosolic beta-glucosidase-like n=1 Tax=Epargyreus clarus TaxID=520877 RepID=UPI003C2ACF1F
MTGKRFPDDFQFGVATSAYQIEGAWNADGKGLSMWDYYMRTAPDMIVDHSNGDVACNSYYLYKRDIEMLKELGVDVYRFSIAWTRILPFGTANYINPKGIAYYNNLIDELLANGIQPFVTMYHWDLPQTFNEKGGWLTEKTVDWFGDYARVLYKKFGDRVKHWVTINEPHVHCFFSYGLGWHPPGIHSPGIGFYECVRNLLLAHARAYHIYNDDFRATQGGKIGISLDMEWPVTNSNLDEDAEAVQDFMAFNIDYYLQPIFSKEGNYPERFIKRIADASKRQGYNVSRLRPFTKEEIVYLRGSADFLGLNHYTSKVVYRNESLRGAYEVPSQNDDLWVGSYGDPSWPHLFKLWLYEYPPGFYGLLMHIKNTYGNPEVYVTENGMYTEHATSLIDNERVQYYRNYLSALLDALYDGANVKGYFAWSLMDNFEWSNGYIFQFGLYAVNNKDPNRTRTARKSALVYKEVIRSRIIDYTYDVNPYEERNGGSIHRVHAFFIFCLSVYLTYVY